MPTGIPKSGKRAPRGSYPRKSRYAAPMSANTQQLLEYQAQLEERIAAARAKDKTMAIILRLADEHGLTAKDLRDAAAQIGKRPKGDAPVVSLHLRSQQYVQMGKKLTEARAAKGLSNNDVCKALKKGSGNVSQWFNGVSRPGPTVQPKLIKLLDLPAKFFEPFQPVGRRANGHAAAGEP
jgi:hypothetical protein